VVTFSTIELDPLRLHVVYSGMSTNEQQEVRQHRFETAGLGKAPFRYVGFTERRGPEKILDANGNWNGLECGAPGQPMGTCDYCGQGIAICCEIVSSDGKRFVVGSDCVEKTGDKGIVVKVKSAVNKLRSEKRKASEAKRIAEFAAELETEELRAVLAALPHPQAWRAEQGETLLDSVEWFMAHAGNAGKMKTIRMVSKLRS